MDAALAAIVALLAVTVTATALWLVQSLAPRPQLRPIPVENTRRNRAHRR